MPDGFTVKFDSRNLEEKLKALSADMQTKIINTALREGAKVYQAAVTEAAPEKVDPSTPGSDALPVGALKSDVQISKVKNASAYRVRFGKFTAHVARFVDEGHRLVKGKTSKKAKTVGKQIGSVPAHPFFRAAFETATADAEKTITESIREQVKKKWKV